MQTSYLSIDIGGTFIKYAHLNKSGAIFFKEKIKTPDSLETFKKTILSIIHSCDFIIKGIGISCPGKIDPQGTVYFGGALPYLHEFSLKEFVQHHANAECTVINDGKACALAELWLGNLKNIENGAAIVLGTGVGGGIIIDGKLLQGQTFQAGEFSFMYQHSNPSSTDHLLGMKASAIRFIYQAATLLNLEDKTDGILVFEALNRNNNPELQNLFEHYCKDLALMIFNLQAILNLQRVVIGGGISEQPILVEEITTQYKKLRGVVPELMIVTEALEIECCKYKNEANILGALYHYFQMKDSSFQ